MFSLYTARKREEEDLRKKNASALERAIHGPAHRRLTETLSASYRNRVEEWMSQTLAVEPPPLYPKPLHVSDMVTQPYKFYRDSRGHTAASNLSHHGGSLSARTHTTTSADEKILPDHLQMSPRKFQTEKERIAEYMKSDERALLIGKERYADPMAYEFRARDKSVERGGDFIFRAPTERQRIADEIAGRNVGGSVFPFEDPKLFPLFREEDRSKWIGGHFRARLPALPVFSAPDRNTEPYKTNVDPNALFRNRNPVPSANGASKEMSLNTIPPVNHPRPFTALVPTDHFVALPADNPRAPKPPVAPYLGTNVLNAGLTSSGIHGESPEISELRKTLAMSKGSRHELPDDLEASDAAAAEALTANGSPSVFKKTYWKAATTLAHLPHPPAVATYGAYSARGPAEQHSTAQQLYKTYRKHLNY